MPFCPNCGEKNEDERAYCPKCGHNLGKKITESKQAKFDYKKYKKWLYPAVSIILLLVIAILIWFKPGIITGVRDCQSDVNCFVKYAKTCQPASITLSSPPLDKLRIETRGLEIEKQVCNVYVKLEELSGPLTDLQGKDAECRIPVDFFTNGTISLDPTLCSGSLVSALGYGLVFDKEKIDLLKLEVEKLLKRLVIQQST